MPKNIPIRHHYIPKFMLRPFADEEGYLQYYDINTQKIVKKLPEEIFVVSHLYRDEINSPYDPVIIEKELARYEGEVAPIIRKFRDDADVTLTIEENEKLKLFLAIMAFRSQRVKEKFGKNASERNKTFYGIYQEDGNLTDFWTRNLGQIVKCRSIKEVLDNPNIDDPMKMFMFRDTFGYEGMYFMVLERRGAEEFIVSDCYPLVMEGEADNGFKMQMYMIYPISQMKAILFVYNGVEAARMSVSGFDRKFFQKPKYNRESKTIKIASRKIYEEDVKKFNQIFIDNSEIGIVIQNRKTIEKHGREIKNC
ncbi:MAG: DUF4238 domain-containing protein [Lachnospiraceae bacterium]|nr:DUF4238 domain-containing protein [Lachnospiraceae bacterium]